ncbi:MAG TPA: amidohydrolase [Thermoanaerobaculia bacterium]|jgi:predicted amidohydrolase YtcJ|nr:amidohydrolase [Thermoanaerobaculia bacterium]
MSRFRGLSAGLVLTACFFLGSAAAQAASPDVILYNGKVFTSDPGHLFAEAVAVRGKRIVAVGSNQGIRALAGPETKLLDLGQRTVIPGLNDAHVHVLVPQGVPLNVPVFVPGPGPTVQEVLDLISAATAVNPPGTWLLVTVGTAFSDDPQANRLVLDQVAPNHPVKLELWTGHGMYFNARGLQTLHISEHAADPFGGFYERFPGTNTLNGVVHEYAEHQIRRKFAQQLSNAQITAIYQDYIQRALRLGFTSVQDMSIGLPQSRGIEILDRLNPPLRWREICFPLTPGEGCFSGRITSQHVTASGIKWIGDGTPIERLAFMTEPYVDLPTTNGRFNFPPNAFRFMLERGLQGPKKENQLLFHLVGDAAIGTLLDEMEDVAPAARWRSRRTRIEHGDLILPSDIPRVRDLGIVVVQNATHLALTDVLPARYSPQTVAHAQPLRSLLEAGIPLALGTDGIGFSANPFLDIMLATLHPDRPSEALTREQAVIAYTQGSAYAEGEEDRKGRLAPGQLADLAVLSQDLFTVPFGLIPGTTSELTMVDGHIVWNSGMVHEVP